MSTPITMHFSGGLKWRESGLVHERFEGLAVCCTGDKARGIRRDKRQTTDITKVTCLHCLKMWRKVEELKMGRTGT